MYIYDTVNFGTFCDRFRDMGRNDSFSYKGKRALFEHLEQLAEDQGEPIELDVISLVCEFTEYTASEYLSEYRPDDVDTETLSEYLSGEGHLIAEWENDTGETCYLVYAH